MIFSCFTWKLKEKVGGLLGGGVLFGGGGGKGYVGPPLKLLGAWPPPLPTPMLLRFSQIIQISAHMLNKHFHVMEMHVQH